MHRLASSRTRLLRTSRAISPAPNAALSEALDVERMWLAMKGSSLILRFDVTPSTREEFAVMYDRSEAVIWDEV